MKLRSIIVEDEYNNQELLKMILQEHAENVDILDCCFSKNEAKLSIEKHNPDLVFLDIELTDGNAFELLDLYDSYKFLTIFITGYEKFSLKAIKYSGIDYILKPYSVEDILSAIKKASSFYDAWKILSILSEKNNKSVNLTEIDSIIIKTKNGNQKIEYRDILYITIDESYCRVYIKNNTFYYIESTLKYFESILPAYFFRIHKAHIVNLKKVTYWDRGKGGELRINENIKLPISHRSKSKFNVAISNLSQIKKSFSN